MNQSVNNLICEAGDMLREAYFQDTVSHEKQRWELVTEVDLMIERLLIRHLSELYKGDGFAGEECGEQAGTTGRRWIIDPIDGTSSFIMGQPYFSISLALEQDQQIIEGYVYNPISSEFYSSTQSQGQSFLNGQVISVSQTTAIESSLVAFGFSARMDQIERYYQDWNSLFTGCRKGVGWICPALSLCNVARGRIDAFIDYGASMHGQAAASLIVKNAGGVLFDAEMTPYSHQSVGIIGATEGLESDLRRSRL